MNTAEIFKHGEKFDAPQGLPGLYCYIQQLVEQGEFELIAEESTCPLEKVKNEDGWADEIMAHMIRVQALRVRSSPV